MKALVVYYSRTGNTKKVGDEIAKALGCDVEELKDTKDRSGMIGWIKSGADGSQKTLAKLQPVKTDASGYDLVIVGTPIWASRMSPAVRTYLAENKAKLKGVAFFCTGHKAGNEKAIREMEELSGKKTKAMLTLTEDELKTGAYADKTKKFAGEIKA